tara:strand:+ start:466 stop:1107 length:642 start_codon:yes stop_codon:yes gene_type:complete
MGLIVQHELSKIFFSIGMFAISGSITNWLAVHMLFDKVKFLYGSGVILDRFDEIKLGIKNLALEELFTKDKIKKYLLDKNDNGIKSIISKIDYDKLFEGLLDAIESSKLGGMLVMLGGRKALLPLKEPIITKLKSTINEKLKNLFTDSSKVDLVEKFKKSIEKAIDSKLQELKPEDVKMIIEKMIRVHLGWLIVWGGVFGGLFGLIFSLIGYF